MLQMLKNRRSSWTVRIGEREDVSEVSPQRKMMRNGILRGNERRCSRKRNTEMTPIVAMPSPRICESEMERVLMVNEVDSAEKSIDMRMMMRQARKMSGRLR